MQSAQLLLVLLLVPDQIQSVGVQSTEAASTKPDALPSLPTQRREPARGLHARALSSVLVWRGRAAPLRLLARPLLTHSLPTQVHTQRSSQSSRHVRRSLLLELAQRLSHSRIARQRQQSQCLLLLLLLSLLHFARLTSPLPSHLRHGRESLS